MSTTTQATHTPGPWIFTSDGDAPMTHSIRGANRMWVAEIHDTAGTQHEVLANARLIAAAPELLLWLKRARDYVPEVREIGAPKHWQEEIDEIIARAAGA